MNDCCDCAAGPFNYCLCNKHYYEYIGVNMDDRLTPEELKMSINIFLWDNLPPSATLESAEAMSRDFFEQIMYSWDKHCPEDAEKEDE